MNNYSIFIFNKNLYIKFYFNIFIGNTVKNEVRNKETASKKSDEKVVKDTSVVADKDSSENSSDKSDESKSWDKDLENSSEGKN